jgi:hypothetical protein
VKVLWATTFSADLYATSGHLLLDSFVKTRTPGTLVAYTEGMDLPETPSAVGHRLEGDPILADFLAANRDVIPRSLGGLVNAPECRCRKGPFDVHSKRHKLPCVGYWFCKNAFRWLRKVVAAKRAADAYGGDHDLMVWVDSDARFLQTVPPEVVASWFSPRLACFYLKSKRTAIETGVVGYNMRTGGRKVIDRLVERYTSGRFRKDARWDDCVQLGAAIKASGMKCVDLATAVGERNTVIQHSPLGEYLGHDKGLHRRTGALK